ncbi:MAG TPA: hypothetical protein VFM21_07600 [Terriglobia bacterium]|nr:hypothetical protein [Terriglobia bacterium]
MKANKVGRLRRKGWIPLLALFLAALWFAAHTRRVAAENGRDFAGNYSLSDASQSGDTTTLTFSMQVFNYSGADVSNATVTLEDSDQPGVTYATFSNVSIASNDSVQLSAQATLPSAEVDRWSQGGSPQVTIQFTDGDGLNRAERVELGPAPPGQ